MALIGDSDVGTHVPPWVPDRYRSDVVDAAAALGLPVQLVAEQIAEESNFDPNAVSPAGAEGIAQFEPETFATYGPSGGSPFNPGDAFAAYKKFMGELLKWSKGNVRQALAAYNAGQGNWHAGTGYAESILSRSGNPGDLTAAGNPTPGQGGAPSTSDSSKGLLPWPGEITDWFKARLAVTDKAFSLADSFFQTKTYVRFGAGFIGVIFLIMGIIGLVKAAQQKD